MIEVISEYSNDNSVLQVNHLINEQNIQNENEKTYESLAIAWINLTLSKKSCFSKEKVILNNINGQIHFATITALLGPSGAGKTTLLRCINGFNQSDISNNSVFYVNKTKSIRSCFIMQEHNQHLIMKLTVKESLMYSSLLKNYQIRRYKFNHEENVEKILDDLLLTNCKDNLVVNCSGGEQKRLSIGLELTSIVKPNLLCIDEPTTGIDSNACEKVGQSFVMYKLIN